MIPSSISNNVISFPLVGRACIFAILKDATGTAFTIGNTYRVDAYFLKNPDDDLSNAILVKHSNDSGIIVTTNIGEIFIDLVSNVALFSALGLYTLQVTLTKISDGQIGLLNSFFLMPIVQYITEAISAVGSGSGSVVLSTGFENTLDIADYVGGVGYLDGISTLIQPVKCWIKFIRVGQSQPEEWELVVWTSSAQNTDPGNYQLGLDFNSVTNPKVWVRRT